MEVNNLSKSLSLASFSSENCVEALFKGCVHYIFVRLFSKSKGEPL